LRGSPSLFLLRGLELSIRHLNIEKYVLVYCFFIENLIRLTRGDDAIFLQ
jgi:hypothetical protein